jgi:glutaredoxin
MGSPSSVSQRRRRRGASIPKNPRVTLYHAEGCHLCERVRGTLAELRQEHGFELEEVDIDGDPALEARYREWLPVVEIDGERAFVYHLDRAAFLRRIGAQSHDAKTC